MSGPDVRVHGPVPAPDRAPGKDAQSGRAVEQAPAQPPRTTGPATPMARALGNQVVWRLQVGAPGDPAERSAEEAEQPSRWGAPAQRAGTESARRESVGRDLPPAVMRALTGPGEPLADPVRAWLEEDSGRDLAGVQVHTGPAAAALADALGARAFTVGLDIGFGAGQYAPDTVEGRRTLAHEADHVTRPARATAGVGTGAIDIHRRLALTGAAADLDRVVAIMNYRMTPLFQARVAAGGVVEIVATGNQGPPTAANQLFTERLRAIVDEAGTTTVGVVAGGRPIVGSYALAQIDVADMEQLGFDQPGWDAGAALLHELVEQRQRQLGATVAEREFGTATSGAHGTALAAELGVIGAALESDTGLVPSGAPGAGGGLSGSRTVVFRYPDGRRVRVEVTLVNNNITGVRRRWLP